MRTLKTRDWFHADGFPIAVERRDPQEPFGLNSHEFSEIVLVTGGRGLHVVGDYSWTLATGDVFVIGDNCAHDYEDLDDLQLTNVLFQQEALSLRLSDLASLPGYHALFTLEPVSRRRRQFKNRLRLEEPELKAVMRLVDQLEFELGYRDCGFRFMATATFMQLVGNLSRCYDRSQSSESNELLSIAEAIAYLETNFAQQIQLDDLVHIAQMSRRSFLRAFESAVGCTPIAHVIRLRIDRAAELLRTTSLSVTEIAYDVGFNDSNYFSRQFRHLMSCTPRQFRQQAAIVSASKST